MRVRHPRVWVRDCETSHLKVYKILTRMTKIKNCSLTTVTVGSVEGNSLTRMTRTKNRFLTTVTEGSAEGNILIRMTRTKDGKLTILSVSCPKNNAPARMPKTKNRTLTVVTVASQRTCNQRRTQQHSRWACGTAQRQQPNTVSEVSFRRKMTPMRTWKNSFFARERTHTRWATPSKLRWHAYRHVWRHHNTLALYLSQFEYLT